MRIYIKYLLFSSGEEAYITLDKTKLEKIAKLVFSTKSEKDIRVYEIIPSP